MLSALARTVARAARPSASSSRSICIACQSSPLATRPLAQLGSTRSLVASQQQLALVDQVRTFKIHSSVKKMCEACQIVVRKGRVTVVCKKNPRHKQRLHDHSLAAAQTGDLIVSSATGVLQVRNPLFGLL